MIAILVLKAIFAGLVATVLITAFILLFGGDELIDACEQIWEKVKEVLNPLIRTNSGITKITNEGKEAFELSMMHERLVRYAAQETAFQKELERTCVLIQNVSDRIDREPGFADNKDVHTMTDLYLPEILSILGRMENMEVDSDNDQERIRKAVITINVGLEDILRDVHENDLAGLMTDVEALQGILDLNGVGKEGIRTKA